MSFFGSFGRSRSIWEEDEYIDPKLDQMGNQSTNKNIERALIQDDKDNKIKVLLLGTGESGKSTIFKQMKIINISDYTDTEREAFRECIFSNVLQDLHYLLEGAEKLGLKSFDPQTSEIFDEMIQLTKYAKLKNPIEILTRQVGEKIQILWKDEFIRKLFLRRSEFYINDTASYFFEKVMEIVDSKYVPSNADILHARKRTTGVTELNFKVDSKHNFKFIDLGGQRSERKKWLKVFDNVTAVLFITSMSEYDQVLFEDETKNRMTESLELWEEILSLEHFKKTPIIIFFNKFDLFKEKIKTVDLSRCFPDYKDGCDEDKAKTFIRQKYFQISKNRKEIYYHYTTATDTNLIQNVFNTIKVIFVKKLLDSFNML